MRPDVDLLGRARIEWAVWSLDQRLYELPRRIRIDRRRELRTNLLAAARDDGIGAALEGLGDGRRLARGYIDAELGPGPRPSWILAALIVTAFPFFFLSISTEVTHSFRDGIVAMDPSATGTYATDGISGLQAGITYTLVDGVGTYSGGGMTPLAWGLLLLVVTVVGRLWLIPRGWWRRSRARARVG